MLAIELRFIVWDLSRLDSQTLVRFSHETLVNTFIRKTFYFALKEEENNNNNNVWKLVKVKKKSPGNKKAHKSQNKSANKTRNIAKNEEKVKTD